MELIAYQKETDYRLQEALESGSYTAENPYIELNPYSNSPLTAVIIFNTEEECYISIEVEDGLEENSGDSFLFSEYTTKHVLLN